MSSAINFGGVPYPNINRATEHGRQRDRQYDHIRVTVDYRRSALWTKFALTAPAHISESLLDELQIACDAIKGLPASPFRFRILVSERPDIFCLGGDLSLFRRCIEQRNRPALSRYAYLAVDTIWESINGSGYDDLFSIALVQGEAQGGGFEAALSSHMLVAEKGCSFGFPESLFGLFPGMGAYNLLCARTDSQTARKVIGGAQRYSAEDLFEIGVIDFLAEPGCGKTFVENFIDSCSEMELTPMRKRFADISKSELLKTVDQWIDQALALSDKHLRTIGYILQAQKRATHRSPQIRTIKSRRALAGEVS